MSLLVIESLLTFQLTQYMGDVYSVQFALRRSHLAEKYVFIAIWEIALKLELDFSSPQYMSLDKGPELLRALFWHLLLQPSSFFIAAFDNNGTETLREEFKAAKETRLNVAKERPKFC